MSHSPISTTGVLPRSTAKPRRKSRSRFGAWFERHFSTIMGFLMTALLSAVVFAVLVNNPQWMESPAPRPYDCTNIATGAPTYCYSGEEF